MCLGITTFFYVLHIWPETDLWLVDTGLRSREININEHYLKTGHLNEVKYMLTVRQYHDIDSNAHHHKCEILCIHASNSDYISLIVDVWFGDGNEFVVAPARSCVRAHGAIQCAPWCLYLSAGSALGSKLLMSIHMFLAVLLTLGVSSKSPPRSEHLLTSRLL
jgi:hypothetical protein